MPDQRNRWSDEKLEQFHNEFLAHMKDEDEERVQQMALHTAVFQQEDKEKNVPAGLLQMMSRIAERQEDMRIWQDRQKTFVGGVVFTVSSLWFVLSDLGPRVMLTLKKMFS